MIYVGIDIGGMSIKVGFVNEKGEIINKFVRKTNKGEGQEQTMTIIGEMIKQEIIKNNYQDVMGIGVGVPGLVNCQTGYCDYASNLGWENLDVRGLLSKASGIKNIRVANDANAAVLGEARFGIAKGYKNLLMLTLGTGVGGGLFLNNQLYEGNEGKGAELGHSILVLNGRQCPCGRRGCFEQYASATALINDTKIAMKEHKESKMWDYVNQNIDNVDGKTAFETSKLGDETAIKVVKQYTTYLAAGILSFCNIFRPEAIVLGGGICGQGDYLLNPIIKYLKDNEYGYKHAPEVKLLIAKLGNDAGILGAAALVM